MRTIGPSPRIRSPDKRSSSGWSASLRSGHWCSRAALRQVRPRQLTSRRAIAARITALGRLQRCAEPAWSLRWKRKRSGAKAPQLHRCAAQFSAAARSSRRDAVAGSTTIQHSGKHVASGYGVRRAFAGSGRLSENGFGTDHGRRSRKVSGDILPARLLDVVERSKAGCHVGIHRGYLVP